MKKVVNIALKKFAENSPLDCLIKYLFKKKCCICNKLTLFMFFYFIIIIGSSLAFGLIWVLFMVPFFSLFFQSNTKKEELFFNNSTYYDVFTKIIKNIQMNQMICLLQKGNI